MPAVHARAAADAGGCSRGWCGPTLEPFARGVWTAGVSPASPGAEGVGREFTTSRCLGLNAGRHRTADARQARCLRSTHALRASPTRVCALGVDRGRPARLVCFAGCGSDRHHLARPGCTVTRQRTAGARQAICLRSTYAAIVADAWSRGECGPRSGGGGIRRLAKRAAGDHAIGCADRPRRCRGPRREWVGGRVSVRPTPKRWGWDSNPRDPEESAGFQDRCLRPLSHPTKGAVGVYERCPLFTAL